MANTFNGIGSNFYGQSKFGYGGSFVTTKWFVLAFFPIFPMKSYRLRYEDSSGIPFLSRSSSYELLEELPIDWVQVIKTWAYSFSIVALVAGMMLSKESPTFKIFVMTAGCFLPFMLRWFSKSMAGNN